MNDEIIKSINDRLIFLNSEIQKYESISLQRDLTTTEISTIEGYLVEIENAIDELENIISDQKD